jgi:hypothetical protein
MVLAVLKNRVSPTTAKTIALSGGSRGLDQASVENISDERSFFAKAAIRTGAVIRV